MPPDAYFAGQSHSLEDESPRPRPESQQVRAPEPGQVAAAGQPVDFRTAFEQSPLGQKIINPDLTILRANAALVALLNCTGPDELEGKRILDFAHPLYRADWAHMQQRLWAHHIPHFTVDTCMVRADGSSFWCQAYTTLFTNGGQELGYTTLVDTTAHRELEASLKRLYDTQESVLHLVAHDVKTPIAHIQMLVELLRREGAGHLEDGEREAGQPSEIIRFLELIEHACADACALLKDVLYIGELDADHLKKKPTDLNAFLDAQLTVHRLAAQQKGISLALEVPAHVVTAPLNPNKFGRVVANLLTNALKFTPAGGQVVVRLSEYAGRPRIMVQDTGVGIAPGLQTHIFDKFSTAARVGLAGEESTGLGLFITQQIVRLHGGTIWLESVENEGTTFFIDL